MCNTLAMISMLSRSGNTQEESSSRVFEALETSWVAVFRHLVISGRALGRIPFFVQDRSDVLRQLVSLDLLSRKLWNSGCCNSGRG